MKVDRYTKVMLTVIAVALSTLAFKDIVAPQPAVAAAQAVHEPAAGEAARYQLIGTTDIDTWSGTLYGVPPSALSTARRYLDTVSTGYYR